MIKRSRIIAFVLIVGCLGGIFAWTVEPIMKNVSLGLDLQGGFEVQYQVDPAKEGQTINEEALKATASALNRRVDVLGVNDPSINIEGETIRVQLAGVKDADKARKILSTEANLTLRDYQDKVMLDGADFVENGAYAGYNDRNQICVFIKLKDASKFYNVTNEVYGKPDKALVIWLDFEEGVDSYATEKVKAKPKFISAPGVNDGPINSETATISGSFTIQEAQELSEILNAGALPTKLTEIYSTSVGAQFGKNALDQTMLAGIIALALVFAFMIYFYRFPGFLACITLTIYCYVMIFVFEKINGVLTLPGIAALILGVGIAVDANIIADERIKDELRKGRTVKAAFKEGNKHSIATIIDAHVTTLIVSIVLFIYGTSSVKGFATMLFISIIVGFCTAVYGTRGLMKLWVDSNFLNNRLGWLHVKKSQVLKLKDVNNDLDIPTRFDKYDFIKHSKKFFIVSLVLTVVGIGSLFISGLNTSIDFSSGSRIEVVSDKSVSVDVVKEKFDELGIKVDDAITADAGAGNESVIVRVKGELSQDQVLQVKSTMSSTFGHEPNISTVSSIIGKELAKNALISVLIASIGIIIYITIRFEWRMAIAAIVSLLHDAFFIVTVFSLIRFEVDLTFIAAVLTILGYSINDTIVTFDRIRENMKKAKKIRSKEEVARIANISIRQTLRRSINTVVTVILTVLAMLIFGSHAIFNFNFALLVGLMIGMYSSVLIAVPIWVFLKGKQVSKTGGIKTEPKKSIEGTV